MKNIAPQFVILTLMALLLTTIGCKPMYVNYMNANAVTVQTLQIATGDISRWQQEKETDFNVYVGDELYGPEDGGAPKYLQKGMIEASIQTLKKDDGKILDVLVMDFGTSSNAELMFMEQVSTISPLRQVLSIPLKTAGADENLLDACTAYSHTENFYFELRFRAYNDKSVAIQDAYLFLKTYNAKINQMK